MTSHLICPTWISQIQVRHLAQSDLPALEWGGEYTHFRRLYREIYQTSREGKAIMWVADLAGSGVIGQLFVQLISARKELADGLMRAYIYGFRVRPVYRGIGIGTRLLTTVEADLVRRKFRFVTLNVSRDNLDARRFYERHGYQVVADEPGRWSYLDDQGQRCEVYEPAWRMQKQILIPLNVNI